MGKKYTGTFHPDSEIEVPEGYVLQRYRRGKQLRRFLATSTSQIIPPEPEVPVTSIKVADIAFNASYPLITTLDATCTVNVSAGNNRKLIAFVHLPANDTITGVTANGVPMSLVTGNVVGVDGARSQCASMWELDNPPLGSITITATRNLETSSRFGVGAIVLHNAAQEPAIDVAPVYFEPANQLTYKGNDVAVTRGGQLALFMYSIALFNTSDAINLSGGTSEGRIWSTGSNQTGCPYWIVADTPGTITNPTVSIAGGGQGGHNCQGLAVVFNNTSGGGSTNRFFVDGTDGNDANDGTDQADPIKTLTKLSSTPLAAGGEVVFKAGTVARQTSVQSPTVAPLVLSNQDLTVEPYDTGEAPALFGDVVYATGWGAIPAGEASAFAISNGVKRALGNNSSRFAMPCIDGKMLYPAAWCPEGSLADPAAFTDYQPGSEACRFTTSVQISGTTPDFSKEIAYGISGSTLTIYLTHPSIATHYGALASDALNGGMIVYRDDSNTERYATITGYSQANSRITATVGYTPSMIPHQGVAVFWAIRFVPFDISVAGQYGFDKTVANMYAAFPAGTTRSIVNAATGFVLTGNGASIEGLTIGRVSQSAVAGGTRHTLTVAGSNQAIADCTFKQSMDPTRPSALAGTGTITGLTLSGITGLELYTNGFIRLQAECVNGVFDNLYCRDSGRTMVLLGASDFGCANGNLVTNCDFNDHLSVHGNGLSTYTGSYDNTFERFSIMGSVSPVSSQLKNAPELVVPRNNVWRNFIISHPRTIDGTLMGTHQFRLDGGETGGTIDRGLMVVVGNSGLALGVSDYSPEKNGNEGLVVNRAVIEGVSAEAGTPSGVTDVTFKNALILVGDGVGQTQAALTGLGATFENCTFVTLPAGSRAAGTNGAWNGSPTIAMQEHITRTDDWTVAVPTYENVQIGPDKWGINRDKGPWIIPAYGSSFAMVDLWLTTDRFNVGTQAGKQLGSICGGSPGSILSLPAGEGDNDMFILDPRGMVRATSRLATADSYSLVVRETNGAASNGPAHDTMIPIIIN